MDITFKVEPITADLFVEILPLARRWWDEGGFTQPFNPVLENYYTLWNIGKAKAVTARLKDGRLIGFALLAFTKSNFSGRQMCFCESIYLEPEYRKSFTGSTFLNFVTGVAANKGAKELLITSSDKRDLTPVYSKLEFKPVGQLFYKEL